MSLPSQRRPTPGTDVVHALGLYTLFACCLLAPAAYGAEGAASGAETQQAREMIQKREPIRAVGNGERDLVGQDIAISGRQMTTPASNVDKSTALNGRQTAALRGGGIVSSRGGGLMAVVHAKILRRGVGTAANKHVLLGPSANLAVNRSARPTGAARTTASITAVTNANRQLSRVLPDLYRSTPSLKAQAGNGTIGGPDAPGGGMVGGPANGRTAPRTSIDGAALWPRF